MCYLEWVQVEWRYAVIVKVVVGNGFQRRNLVIICLVFTVVCFSVSIQDRLDAGWLMKVFLSKMYFIVVSAFVVSFVLCVSVMRAVGDTVIICVQVVITIVKLLDALSEILKVHVRRLLGIH